jgi:hypothetical protein
MSDGTNRNRLSKLGGIAFIASGFLFLAKSVLELVAGPPPSAGAEILAWIAAQRLLLAMTSEIFFFAVMLLVPAIIALYASLADTHRSSAAIGCGVLAVTIPSFCVLLIVHGRLVYPVYQIQIRTPETAELVVALYYGGLHAVALLLAPATLILSVAMRRGVYGAGVAYLGFATAVLDVAGSYPWVIGPVGWLVCGAFFAAWFVAVGVRLCRIPKEAMSP